MEIVHGPGPRWFRIVLAVVAALYLVGLVKHPPQKSILRPIGFFTECTCLFPGASQYALEFRLEGWSCSDRGWRALDPRPYFPIEADDKESRFQRLGYFYQNERLAMRALDDYILARHADVDDAVSGSIGGIRMFKLLRPLPSPGEPVDRYVYRPLESETTERMTLDQVPEVVMKAFGSRYPDVKPTTAERQAGGYQLAFEVDKRFKTATFTETGKFVVERADLYWSKASDRKKRCGSAP